MLIFEEKMDIGNYLHDSMDFYCIRQLCMKSRHKILVPMLMIHLTKNKTMKKKGYSGSFYRNLHERTDEPVFSIEDAVTKLKASNPTNEIEKSMDQFLISH